MSKAAATAAIPAVAGGVMGALSSRGPSTQTVTSQTQLPGWLDSAAQHNLNEAYGVSQGLLGPYAGPRVAGITPGAQADIASLQGNVGGTNPAFSVAQGTAAGLTGYAPGQVTPGLLSTTDLAPYMNPFTKNVIASGMQAIDTQRQQAINSAQDQAIAQKAFGGSRQGVTEGITNAAAARQAGNLASQLEGENFNQARAAAEQDIGNNLQAQETNQNAGLSGAGLNLSAAEGLGGLATEGQNAFLQGTMGALQGQALAQQQRQNEINAQMGAYSEAQQFPLQQLQITEQALGMTPYGTNSTQSTGLPPGNPMLGALGGTSAALGIMGSLFAPAGGGGLLSGALH